MKKRKPASTISKNPCVALRARATKLLDPLDRLQLFAIVFSRPFTSLFRVDGVVAAETVRRFAIRALYTSTFGDCGNESSRSAFVIRAVIDICRSFEETTKGIGVASLSNFSASGVFHIPATGIYFANLIYTRQSCVCFY